MNDDAAGAGAAGANGEGYFVILFSVFATRSALQPSFESFAAVHSRSFKL